MLYWLAKIRTVTAVPLVQAYANNASMAIDYSEAVAKNVTLDASHALPVLTDVFSASMATDYSEAVAKNVTLDASRALPLLTDVFSAL